MVKICLKKIRSSKEEEILNLRIETDQLFRKVYKILKDDINDINSSQINRYHHEYLKRQFDILEYKLWDNNILSQHSKSIKNLNLYKSNIKYILEYWQLIKACPNTVIGLNSYMNHRRGKR